METVPDNQDMFQHVKVKQYNRETPAGVCHHHTVEKCRLDCISDILGFSRK